MEAVAQEQPQVLTQEQALSVLIQGVRMAQQKGGVYSFEDGEIILKAIRTFTPPASAATPAPAATEEVKKD